VGRKPTSTQGDSFLNARRWLFTAALRLYICQLEMASINIVLFVNMHKRVVVTSILVSCDEALEVFIARY